MQGNGDYIPRQAAREAVWQILNGMGYSEKHNNRLVEEIDAVFDDISAADVRPVVKGTWVGIDDFPHEDWECDHCGCVVGNTDDPWNYYHFCPNCGAEMRPEPPKEEMSMDWLICIAIGLVCGVVSALIVNLLFGRK